MMGREFIPFTGNCPANVSKDAKYSVRLQKGTSVIALVYRANEGEQWHAATESHAELAEMVNAVKVAQAGRPNGPFYINEYRQVIVPAGPDARYYLAGEYHQHVFFDFEGKVLSGDAKNLEGSRINPGDRWVGPHPGIPYVLTADGADVYYELSPRPNVTRKALLSAAVGKQEAVALAARVRGVKGFGGGRFYINEWRQMFAPITRNGTALEYTYIGELQRDDPWFPKPEPAPDVVQQF
jgi:hypothetical protein